MGALWLGALVGVVLDGNGSAFGIAFLFLYDFYVGHVARHYEGDENHHAVHAGNGFAFGSDVGYRDVLKNGLFFLLFHNRGVNCVVRPGAAWLALGLRVKKRSTALQYFFSLCKESMLGFGFFPH